MVTSRANVQLARRDERPCRAVVIVSAPLDVDVSVDRT
jgi:hypothetical protein